MNVCLCRPALELMMYSRQENCLSPSGSLSPALPAGHHSLAIFEKGTANSKSFLDNEWLKTTTSVYFPSSLSWLASPWVQAPGSLPYVIYSSGYLGFISSSRLVWRMFSNVLVSIPQSSSPLPSLPPPPSLLSLPPPLSPPPLPFSLSFSLSPIGALPWIKSSLH